MGGQETLAEKGGVDAVDVVAFAYDIYTTPSKNNGALRATLTFIPRSHINLWLSALNQARLALAEIHQFTDADLSRAPYDLQDPREFALMRMGIYGSLQEWLVAVVG